MWLFLLHRVLAGVPIQLPPGESAADWSAPLELADLSWSKGAALRVVVDGSWWVLRGKGRDGVEHTMRVRRPVDVASREDFAFLARGMVREVGVLQDPAALSSPVSPPPEPTPRDDLPLELLDRLLPVLPTPPRPPDPVAPVEVEPVVEPVADPVRSPVLVAPEVLEPPVAAEAVEPEAVEPEAVEPEAVEPVVSTPVPNDVPSPILELDESPERPLGWWAMRTAHPPLYLSGGVRGRLDRGPGPRFGLTVRGLERSVFRLDIAVQYHLRQRLQLASGSTVDRAELGFHGALRPSLRVSPVVAIGLSVGVEHRIYRQNFRAIDSNTVPVLGLGAQLEPPTTWRAAPFVRAGVDLDLGVTKFTDEFRRSSTMVPLQGVVDVGVRISSRRDPTARVATPSP